MKRGRWTPVGRRPVILPAVVTTFLLRLLDERRAAGEVVGQVEHVGTGATALVKNADELVAFVSGPAQGAGIEEEQEGPQ